MQQTEKTIAVNTSYRWRIRFGGLSTDEAARARELEKENACQEQREYTAYAKQRGLSQSREPAAC